jgi:HK97 gp10 family phage protein
VIEVKVEGLDELRRALIQLPKEIQQKHLRASVSAGARVVQQKARELAPEDTGTLRRAIYRTRSREGSSSEQEMAIVGVRYGRKYRRRKMDAWYWRFHEFGTSKMQARPFIRPAFDTTIQNQIDAIAARLKFGIDKAVALLKW